MACLSQVVRLNLRSIFHTSKLLYSTQTQNNVTKSFFASTNLKDNWIWQKNTDIRSPFTLITPKIDISNIWVPKNVPQVPKLEIIDPKLDKNIEKHTAKLIVIRRHKMRKHKLKKLRKKMKFEWAKRRQRREMKKEKLFQAELIAQIKDAEKFSAEEFVAEKIRKATEIPIPRFWKGKRLPEFIIREKLNLPPK